MKLQILVLFFGIIFFLGFAFEEKANFNALERGDSLFETQEYTHAYQIYDSLFLEGSASETMLLKMALINEGLGEYPKALYFLTLFQQIEESDEAEKKIQELAKEHDLSGYNYGDFDYVRKIFFEYFELIISILFLITLGFALQQAQNFFKKKEHSLSGLLMTFALGLTLILLIRYRETQNTTGIFMAPLGYLMEGASAGSQVLGKIKPGEKIQIEGKTDTWLQVEYKGALGYIRANQVWLVN
jgi:Bacterial SH3 domain